MTEPDQKEIVKQAIKEWMDERYAEIGKYAVRSLVIAGVTYFLFKYIEFRGYHLP